MLRSVKTYSRISASLMAAALISSGTASLQAAQAATPTIPDNLPVFPQVQEDPRITVTLEDGTPVGPETTVHRGDVLLVHGTGFSPDANRGGFPFPVPPGVPNGVYVLYGAFPDQWKPSEGHPSEARTHPHDRMAWMMPDGTLETIPTGSIEMRRSIARETQPMSADGTFTARVTVNPPEKTTGSNWGVYVYPAAGSINAAEEIFVPLRYSAEPGPNTPPAPTQDLFLDASAAFSFAQATDGAVKAKNGATKAGGNTIAFSRDAAPQEPSQDPTRKYKGTVITTAKYTLAEIAVADPWLTPLPDGNYSVTALVSRTYNTGPDEMVRVPIGIATPDQVKG